MGVGTEIAQYMVWPSERPLGVDDPVVLEQYPQPRSEGARLRKTQEVAVELEGTCMERVPESGDELAAEDTAEHLDGKKEGAVGGDPAGVIRSQTASGKYAVDMGMMPQPLIPGVEHAEETYLGSKVPGIASDLKQGLSTGVKE